MNITELDSYNLDDAVKFNDQLNPRLWDDREHLRPEVQERLLEIAEDFREFLGVTDLAIRNITISGSNAAYTYTPNSDIDLHLVVDMPDNPVYRELFDAKKFQYNEQHDITIGGADVELYVQDADQPHISQGIYSLLNNDWLQVPRRVKSVVDDTSTRNKFEKVGRQIESAIKSGNLKRITSLAEKIKRMRQTGLENHGEFGPENLAFKMLRSQGLIKQLYDARNSAKDREFSLKEKAVVPRITYGFRTPQVVEAGTVSLEEAPATLSDEEILTDFINFCFKELELESMPVVKLRKDPQWSVVNRTFGRYIDDRNLLEVAWGQRHIMDVLRTVAHELTHRHQHERESVPGDAGETGSPYENEANAQAGILMRDYAGLHPEYFAVVETEEVDESLRGSAVAALSACIIGGGSLSGCATQQGMQPMDAARIIYNAKQYNSTVIRADVAQELNNFIRAQRGETNAQNQSRLYQLQKKNQQLPPTPANEGASGYIPTKKQAKDPRYSMALTVDIKPGQLGKEANKLNLKTNRQGIPQIANPNGLFEQLTAELESFKQQDLFEINMSPSNLKKLAAQTGALAGMEFEMIVPNVKGGEDQDLEPDYDYDERVASIEDAAQFFDDGDYNGHREIQRLREQMSDSYQEWLSDAWMENFENYKTTIVFRYGKENWSEADIAEILGLDEAAAEALENRGASPEDYMDAAEKVIEDGLDPWLNDAQEDAQEEYYEDDHEEDWLRSQGLNYMSNISDQYEVSWPYYSSGGNEGAGIESVADEFGQAMGRKVNWSANYHGGKREDNAYVVEPDGSLIPSDSDDAGLEFVSPPLPIDEMISDLNKVKAWAKQRGCYTSKAAKTGLHINVSVPGFDNDKLDYVKLAMLLGDEYVLNQFGRLGNSYANSAMGIIKERIAQRPEDAAAMLQKMKAGMGELATKVIHSGTTSKFTSINTKDGYIEFRSPGGDWLDDNFDKIETTLMRFVVALDAAIDPTKYRDEYLKKLYAVLKPKDQNDTLSYFAKFAAGELPKAALKSFIKQAQLERKGKKGGSDSAYTAIPSSGNQKYQIQRIANDEIVGTFNAASDTDANAVARQWMADNALQRVDFRLNRATGQERAEQRTAAPTPVPGIIDIEPDIEQNFVPGSTLDLQRQRQQAAQQSAAGTFRGTWAIKDSQGNTLHTFGGIGNSQADANRVAAGWLARAGYQDGLEVAVVPVMS